MATRAHPQQLLRSLAALDLEERILNGAVLLSMAGIFFPWLSGEWLGGDSVTYAGFGFFTAFLGTAVFVLQAFVLLITVVPVTGGPQLIPKKYRESVRLAASAQATVLLLASLSVLLKITLEFSRLEVRFGIYVSLLSSIAATLYAFIRYQEYRRSLTPELFRHPEDAVVQEQQAFTHADHLPPPPPPPPAPAPEDHPLALSHHDRR